MPILLIGMPENRLPAKPRILTPPSLITEPWLVRALTAIEGDLSKPFSLETVASAAGLSTFHFARRFKRVMGETVGTYAQRIRLELSAALICRSSVSLIDAALKIGYTSQEAYTRAFERQFQVSPGRLRAIAKSSFPTSTTALIEQTSRAQIIQCEGLRLIGMRFFGHYNEIRLFWQRFAEVAWEVGFPLDRAQPIGLIYDDPAFKINGLIRYDCCVLDTGFPSHLCRPPFQTRQVSSGIYVELLDSEPTLSPETAILSICVAYLPVHGRKLRETHAYQIFHTAPWQAVRHEVSIRVAIV